MLAVAAAAATSACGGRLVALHAPTIAPATARAPTPVDVEPMPDATAAAIAGDVAPPGPAAVFTAALNAEIGGRALEGGEPGGYKVRCVLGRFAVRSHAAFAAGSELVVLYADLSCEAQRASDGATVWRGALRGRTAAAAPNVISSDVDVTQRLVDRAMSDAVREMAADLTVRALGLAGAASARVFGDEAQMRATAGLDDTPYGPAALLESPASVEGALRAIDEHEAMMRAAAWNVAAMAAGPGDPWRAGDRMVLDGDPLVRFVQYKALARLGSAAAMGRLGEAAEHEDDPLLAEMLRDCLSSRGVGVPRRVYVSRGAMNASPVTNGTTASP
jgi:hypothetical protein